MTEQGTQPTGPASRQRWGFHSGTSATKPATLLSIDHKTAKHDYFMVYNSYILHTVCKIHFPPRMSKKSTCVVSTTRIVDALSRQSIARRAAPMRPQPSVKPFCFDRNKVGTPSLSLEECKNLVVPTILRNFAPKH